jgi:hypothetical protein
MYATEPRWIDDGCRAGPSTNCQYSACSYDKMFKERHTGISSMTFRHLRPVVARIREDDNTNHAMFLCILHLDSTERPEVFYKGDIAFQCHVCCFECCEVVLVAQSAYVSATMPGDCAEGELPDIDIFSLDYPVRRESMKPGKSARVTRRIIFFQDIFVHLRLVGASVAPRQH